MVCNITDPQQATPITIVNGQIYYSNAALTALTVGEPAVFVSSPPPAPGAASPPGSVTSGAAFTAVLPARKSATRSCPAA
jgi:hypothetical protein